MISFNALSAIITILIFSVINVLLAKFDQKLIAKQTLIKHGINGLVYMAILALPYVLFHDFDKKLNLGGYIMDFITNDLCFVGALLFNRLIVFNISLNLLRTDVIIRWDYIPLRPKSIVDKIGKFFFGLNGKLMYIVYSAIFIALVILSIILHK
jgi:hypothetical protein